ncbi:MAG: aldo/keto reductase [Thermoplasmatota archaeon]
MGARTFVLGGTITIGRIGLGTNRLQTIGSGAREFLREAVQAGVNFVDTADVYGHTESEQLIGNTFERYPAGLVIATKGGMVAPGASGYGVNGRPEHLRNALAASLARLHLTHVELYQLHRPDPNVAMAESVGALADFRREGLIRHIGLSNVTVEQLAEARKVAPIVSVQNKYNLFDRSSEAVLQECERHGIAFIPWHPLAKAQALASDPEVAAIAREHQTSATAVGLAWLLQHSPVMIPIPGSTRIEHVRDNLRAFELDFTPGEMERLGARAQANP